MDSFEQVVSEILWNQGFWVWTSFKVKLTAKDKVDIDRRTNPRWEIDIVAYDAPGNVVHVIECKSYFDNPGVGTRWLRGEFPPSKSKTGFLKLFRETQLRKVVFRRLAAQLVEEKRCRRNPTLRLGLVCGHTKKSTRHELKKHFEDNGWDLYDEAWLRDGLKDIAGGGYENRVSAVVAKLAYREEAQ